MNVCFIGKYPPIEGGVAAENYWTTYGLALRGHTVYVVTNAGEVEARFRVAVGPQDAAWYEPRLEHGSVRVFSSSAAEEKLGYIPTANPFVSKLASLATQTIREFGCDVIVANYFEPYGVAGYLASRFTGVPLVLKHAGSDISRLMREWELATTYKEILKGADVVLTLPRMRERFIGFGVDPARVGIDAPYAIPPHIFEPGAKPLTDLAGEYDLPPVRHPDGTAASLNGALGAPRIGIYGKVGMYKGSFDLVSALGSLAREGVDFNFLAMTQGYDWLFQRFRAAIVSEGLTDRSYLIPFLPNWRVPNFLRTCSMVCFLERDFPIGMHGPIVPREVLACGVPLVLSKEIADKQYYRGLIVDGVTMWVVNDPKDHEELAYVVREALTNWERAAQIGQRGREVSSKIENFERFTGFWDDLLRELVAGRPTGTFRLSSAPTTRERLRQALPWLRALVGDRYDALVDDFEAQAPADGASPSAFVDFLESRRMQLLAECTPYAQDAVRYARRSIAMASDPPDGHAFPYRRADQSDFRPLTLESIGQLRPTLSRDAVIEAYPAALFFGLRSRTAEAEDDAVAPQDGAMRYVLFSRTPNLERCELTLNPASVKLVELCDGTRRTADVIAELERETVERGGTATQTHVGSTVVSALAQFHRAGVLAFH